MAGADYPELIDDLLAAPKEIGGAPAWQEGQRSGQRRLVMPILSDGASTGLELQINAYPNADPVTFDLVLIFRSYIWLVEWATNIQHTNPLRSNYDLSGAIINGPHYHPWSDNRHTCSSKSLPKKLKFARPLPEEITTFEEALAWLCSMTNIKEPPPGLIALPLRTELF